MALITILDENDLRDVSRLTQMAREGRPIGSQDAVAIHNGSHMQPPTAQVRRK